LSCAIERALSFQPEDERTRVRTSPAPPTVDVPPEHRVGVGLLLEQLDDNWNVDDLTALVYGVPKVLAGLPIDAPPDDEMKRYQREFFVTLYRLLTFSDTGPRLPTLLLSLGRDRVKSLLAPWALQPSEHSND
jgi:lysyl-tRNA synthetase class 1